MARAPFFSEFICGLSLVLLVVVVPLRAQDIPQSSSSLQMAPPSMPDAGTLAPPPSFLCPGGFPTDLTVLNCRYTRQQRVEQFVTTSLTDEAMLQSIFGALASQAYGTPSEWPRTWNYYGQRLGASYTGSIGRGAAEFLVGALVRDDPRHIRCADDASPLFRRSRLANGDFSCSSSQRVLHALLDTVTVRKSTIGVDPLHLDDPGKPHLSDITGRHPAWARLAGVFAGALAQYPWEPHAENTAGTIAQRAGISFSQTFLGSFVTEYGSSVTSHLFKSNKPKDGHF